MKWCPSTYIYLFLLVFFPTVLLSAEGFVVGTLVCTPQGYVPIEKISHNDQVITCDFERGYRVEKIRETRRHEVTDLVCIKIRDVALKVSPYHLFFIPALQKWKPAYSLSPGDFLLGAPLELHQIETIEKINQKSDVYDLSLAHNHNYLISQSSLVAHNFSDAVFPIEAVAQGSLVLNALLLTNPVTAPVVVCASGVALIGYVLWTFWSIFKDSRTEMQDENIVDNGCLFSSEQPSKQPYDHQLPPETPNKNDNDPLCPGAQALALLKAAEESKEKADEILQKTCDYLATSRGITRVMHAFRANCEHNFEPLLARVAAFMRQEGTENDRRVIEIGTKIMIDISKKIVDMGAKLRLDSRGVFENIVIEYEGELITLRGRLHEGVIKIGTMFIQPQHVRAGK